jgi:hypothetical protein
LKSVGNQTNNAWIVDHGEIFADKLAMQVAEAVAKEVHTSAVDMDELNHMAQEFRNVLGIMKDKLRSENGFEGAERQPGHLSTVQEEQSEYHPPTPQTLPEDQVYMNPPAGIAEQGSRGADMTIESAIRHQQEHAAEMTIAAENQEGSDDDTIDPDMPVAVGEPVEARAEELEEEDSKMSPEELKQYNAAVQNGIAAGVEILFDAQAEYPEVSNLTFSGVETSYRRNLAAEQAARDAAETAIETAGDTLVDEPPGAPIIERRVTRAAAAAAASRNSADTSEPEPTRLEMDSNPTSESDQRGRSEGQATPDATANKPRSKSSEKKVQGNLDIYFRAN